MLNETDTSFTVSLLFLGAAILGFAWIYRIGVLWGSGDYAKAKNEAWILTAGSIAAGILELAVYGPHLPLVWIVILAFVQGKIRRLF